MASPQKEKGYTAIAHTLLEALARTRINGEARQILDHIFRKTYGFHKLEDQIALSQFTEATGLKKNSACRAIEKLVQMNMIIVHQKVNECKTYKINKDFDKWLPVTKRRTTIHHKVNKQVTIKGTTKDTTKVKRYKKEAAMKSREVFKVHISPKEMQDLVDLFKPLNPMYRSFFTNTTERKCINRVVDAIGLHKMFGLLRALPEIVTKPYAPKITSPYELHKGLGKLILYFQQEKAREAGDTGKGKGLVESE